MEMHKVSVKFKSALKLDTTFSRARTSSTWTRHTNWHLGLRTWVQIQRKIPHHYVHIPAGNELKCLRHFLTPHVRSETYMRDAGDGLQTCLNAHVNHSN